MDADRVNVAATRSTPDAVPGLGHNVDDMFARQTILR
jgi:hypothetical protein